MSALNLLTLQLSLQPLMNKIILFLSDI
uniref:Uncharacterized protein n=1 Tax=Lepeophtheirus salmonis TaxID=72036 RepID=A0A0K2UUT7_LEPSM